MTSDPLRVLSELRRSNDSNFPAGPEVEPMSWAVAKPVEHNFTLITYTMSSKTVDVPSAPPAVTQKALGEGE